MTINYNRLMRAILVAAMFACLLLAEPPPFVPKTVHPIRSMRVSVPVEGQDQFLACLENYAEDHGYRFVAAVKNPVQGSILVELKNRIVEISAYNPFFRSKYQIHFYDLSGVSAHIPSVEDPSMV
ncbi:hypothetical protein K1W69_01870 [Hoeflea sp. WL0058]|uniref:Uncharacterized protein n=1 Tax=Flavimaribacter sediminis TaxID=2865987 RepID=A0AAE3CZP2_9HYPH|nr:hypothetical protein [Flavimaribacter sediminis]MBW8635916.1 hypothetical protein [Flavimaribacter sediminis]